MDNATDNKVIISSKKYEDKELILIKNLKKNNKSIFLDIGANMGYYSIMSSDYGFDKIYSFEPVPKMIYRIQKHNQGYREGVFQQKEDYLHALWCRAG